MPRRKISRSKRLSIAQRAGFHCEYCKTPEDFSTEVFNIEHVIPLVHGGTDADDNLAYSCGGCNGNKHFHVVWTDPQTEELAPLFHPRKGTWKEHFSWNEDLTLLIGLTPEGRATLNLLRMNRTGLVNLRKALLSYGIHPDI
jgi:5-methylcytosine-specific restriction endonuclease McrA